MDMQYKNVQLYFIEKKKKKGKSYLRKEMKLKYFILYLAEKF